MKVGIVKYGLTSGITFYIIIIRNNVIMLWGIWGYHYARFN